jgi:hypothetical protein
VCARKGAIYISQEPLKAMVKRFCIVVILAIAFAYIEAAVVVYLRTIFHSDGFTFPLHDFPISENVNLLLTEIGREAATLVLILTGAWLAGRNFQQRFAYFLTIFAVWDIFYYVWLKILVNWPSSVMDWDILFLMPMTWASPVLAPVLVSLMLLLFAVVILYRCYSGVPLDFALIDWFGFFLAAMLVIVSFCIAGLHITERDFQSHFYWPLFALGNIAALVLFFRRLLTSR